MDSDINIKRCTGQLPIGFAGLEMEAIAEGHNHLARLAAEIDQSPSIFHAMFACYVGETLAGIGAITDEPSASKSSSMWRMRRLYVRRQFRRRHIGRMIVAALLKEAYQRASIVTVHAGNSEAPKFWEGIGFRRVAKSNFLVSRNVRFWRWSQPVDATLNLRGKRWSVAMDQGFRRGFTTAEKTELWDRWQRGDHNISEAGKPAA